MNETVDDLSYDYEEDGNLVRRQLNKEVLSKGAWATLMFLYEELDKAKNTWRGPKASIVRFKKFNGQYRKQSNFNISSGAQAHQIMEVLTKWFPETTEAETSDDE